MPEGLNQASMYYDPFAPEGGRDFDPLAMMADIAVKYQNREIEHDYTADQFVADAEALALDSHFNGLMEQVAMMEQAMHDMCGDHDPALQNSINNSSVFGRKESSSSHDDHGLYAGHGHGPEGHGPGGKSESKKKKRRPYEGLLAMLARVSKANQDFYKQFKFASAKKR